MNLFLILHLVSILMLLVLSAFFSGAETGLIRMSKIKVKHWIYTQSSNRDAWINWLSKPQDLITTILVGNTLVNILLSSLMATFAMYLFKDIQKERVQTFAGIFAFFIVLIFGEIVPKLFSRQNPERVSAFALRPLFALSKVLAVPFKEFLNVLSNLLPLFKQPAPGRVSALSLDEIRAILQDPSTLKGVKKELVEMMQKVLEMHQTTIQQIMTPWKNVDILVLEDFVFPGPRMERFVDQWVESGHMRIPVIKGNPPKVVGYLFTRDLIAYTVRERRIEPYLLQKWIRPIPNIAPEKKLIETLDLFRFGSPIACVRDKMGFPLGIVTLEDILEEFVGEILDEYDLQEKRIDSAKQ